MGRAEQSGAERSCGSGSRQRARRLQPRRRKARRTARGAQRRRVDTWEQARAALEQGELEPARNELVEPAELELAPRARERERDTHTHTHRERERENDSERDRQRQRERESRETMDSYKWKLTRVVFERVRERESERGERRDRRETRDERERRVRGQRRERRETRDERRETRDGEGLQPLSNTPRAWGVVKKQSCIEL